ncbi:MAG: hypothetical protein LKK19_06305 [Bacteroidales bacterium]|jgi:hypothetical protein|nr:hypothetical protein [Bacteroidales bacterium]MCI2122298.1 hypothetical protein [Bacteroidales bacterium]MCI2145062.1 hypothetical protein [Bacteroidales bacterium]
MALFKFVFSKKQLPEIAICFMVCTASYVLLKYCFPFLVTTGDSFNYLFTAARHSFGLYRPNGYSKYLFFLSNISGNANAIFPMQMLLYFLTGTFTILTFKYYYPIKKAWIRYLICFVAMANPTCLFFTNAMLSDMLFACMLFIMLSCAIIFMKSDSPGIFPILLFTAAFAMALFTRYSAIFLPIVFIPVFLFVKKKSKWLAVASILAVVVWNYSYVSGNMKSFTVGHKSQYSTGFSGWQLANNAMHVVPYTETTDLDGERDTILKQLHHSIYANREYILEETGNGKNATAAFLWDEKSPLKRIQKEFNLVNGVTDPVSYVYLGGLYSRYGKKVILRHPIQFMKHYLLPNMASVFFPKYRGPMEKGTIAYDTRFLNALGYLFPKTSIATIVGKADHDGILKISPAASYYELLTWLAFLAAAVCLFTRKRRLRPLDRSDRLVLWMIVLFGFVFYGTTAFASPIEIRYWMPMTMLKTGFVWIVAARETSARLL